MATTMQCDRGGCSMAHTIQFALLNASVLAGGTADAADDTALAWAALRGDGHVALIRHAQAPARPAILLTTSSMTARPSAI